MGAKECLHRKEIIQEYHHKLAVAGEKSCRSGFSYEEDLIWADIF